MNSRETNVSKARENLSDLQLITFLQEVKKDSQGVLAVELINWALDDDLSLDDIFYTGEEFGYELYVEKQCGAVYEITFKCIAGELAGDGGIWEVEFIDDNTCKAQKIGWCMS